MKESKNQAYVKRTQKDYSYAFKLQVVSEIENGYLSQRGACRKYGIQSHSTVKEWLRKYGNFDKTYQIQRMPQSPESKLMELEQKVKLLEKQNQRLVKELQDKDKKVILFDMFIDMAEKEYKIPIRKNSCPE